MNLRPHPRPRARPPSPPRRSRFLRRRRRDRVPRVFLLQGLAHPRPSPRRDLLDIWRQHSISAWPADAPGRIGPRSPEPAASGCKAVPLRRVPRGYTRLSKPSRVNTYICLPSLVPADSDWPFCGYEITASVHSGAPITDEPVRTDQQPHAPLPRRVSHEARRSQPFRSGWLAMPHYTGDQRGPAASAVTGDRGRVFPPGSGRPVPLPVPRPYLTAGPAVRTRCDLAQTHAPQRGPGAGCRSARRGR
jgi:hypothetical protein